MMFAIYVALNNVYLCFRYVESLLLVSGKLKHKITSFVEL